jgi:methylthioribose-1-phosphate isomerase
MKGESVTGIGTRSPAQQHGTYQLLPFVLNPKNIARFDAGRVIIGDRRKYPFEQSFVSCRTVAEVASAIEGMVTQGSGPWLASVNALRLLTFNSPANPAVLMSDLLLARNRLVRTRPTNTAMTQRLDQMLGVAKDVLATNGDVDAAIAASIEATLLGIYDDYTLRALAMADLINDGDGILTNCFGEAGVLLSFAFARKQGKDVTVYAPETRPYFQGAKLTAPSLHEMAIQVNLITDNMPAHIMSEGKVQKYITAADLITLDGHVVNKIGTFQNAISAHAHDIPFFAFAWGRDDSKKERCDIVIEERDSAEIKLALGTATTIDAISARYPAFDITPPNYVSGVVTVHGIASPYDLKTLRTW